MREDEVQAIGRLTPVLQVIKVLQEFWIVKVAVLRKKMQVLRIGKRLDKLELCLLAGTARRDQING